MSILTIYIGKLYIVLLKSHQTIALAQHQYKISGFFMTQIWNYHFYDDIMAQWHP